ncbi:MAG: excinuclease ABC subunit C, partial [Firmicutes bacterium]|nr:excinuclease ABC subunit C [Bacillota bacterium]
MRFMFDIKEELKKLPDRPGVYIMKDKDGGIIYIGKARVLKNRVRSYFSGTKKEAKTAVMVPHIAEFEYIVVDNEVEALILECNLIKEHRPKYNILLHDDKTYPYIKISLNEDFPRITKVRKHPKRDGAKYIGPITDGFAANELIELCHKLWPIRKCSRVLPRDFGKERPCLNHHLGLCVAPCTGEVSKEEYGKMIKEALDFLEGRSDAIKKRLEDQMLAASEEMNFEEAAALRDKLRSIKSIEERQKMSRESFGQNDIIAIHRAETEALAQVFFVRDGKLLGREHFFIKNIYDAEKPALLAEFLKRFYSGTPFVPREIFIEEPLPKDEAELIENWLSSLRGSKVSLSVPKKGDK